VSPARPDGAQKGAFPVSVVVVFERRGE